MTSRFAVGIDLGTTNSVLAYAPIAGGRARALGIPQLVDRGELEALTMLPSALYAPLEGEQVPGMSDESSWVVGTFGRRRGAEVVGRLVTSSKSWLVHPTVDRAAAILPWGAEEGVPRLSPVDAAARVLAHLRRAWDAEHPDDPLPEQEVVLAVPASFDEVARELTVEAARRAGLSPRLIEEPQAAFYDWMAAAGTAGLTALLATTGGEALVLVVDVGGGTTDLSMVRVSSVERVERVAVGPHLLLGGDNMDLALAHTLEPRMGEGSLDAARFAQLVAACRDAKETLLGNTPPDDVPVTVATAGARLVGGTRTTRLSREEAERVVLEGFLPRVDAAATPQRSRSALVGFGLPYERDVAITRHVAAFLRKHLPAGTWPNAVLLNGGVFRASRIAHRLLEAVAAWRGGAPLTRLPDADPDLAVARGAVAYALTRLDGGIRIGGGSARGYYVAVDEQRSRAVCVVPKGAEEGVVYGARGRTFALATGRLARFDVFASDELNVAAGDLVSVDDERFTALPPLATTIAGDGSAEVRVVVEGELTPVGTLDLFCAEPDVDPPRRFRLAFRLDPQPAPVAQSTRPASMGSRPPTGPLSRLEPARHLVDRAFGKPRPDATHREAKDLLRELEKVLGERSQWTAETCRGLFDAMLPEARGRKRSADHERVFWLLVGWCVRPGFGDARDPQRVAALFALFDERLSFPAEARGWQQFFVAWRRAAGGLDEAAQTRIRDFVDPHLAPAQAGLKKPKKPALSLDDALDMAAWLERVPAARRALLGSWVLERTWTDRDPRLWAALGRLGARVPAYASAHHVVPPLTAERWLDHLLREKWDPLPTAVFSAVELARRTGDRARDVPDGVRAEVERRLLAAGAPDAAMRAVREVVEVDALGRGAFFGEELPVGLRLVE